MKKKEKLRNNGTMTESAFWGFIRSTLRQKSRWWKPIQACKNDAKRNYKGDNKRQKYEYLCSNCKNWFPSTAIEVDHIHPVGSLTCKEDLPNFVENLFCEKENLRVLCKPCHYEVTMIQKNKKYDKK